MTREEKLASIYRGGTVYRPLQEENSILLEVQLDAAGTNAPSAISHGSFELLPLEEVRPGAKFWEN